MSTHRIATREQWRAERLDLLEAEKDLTHRSDELARRRQELPWVKIDKDYRFDTDEGSASLPICSRAARSCSSIISCSAPITAPAARPARRSPTASTASRCTSPTTM